ncbi:TetR/AcrR family transcriptional regulator [Ulvibacterium marinum]|uniref:TetR/AcrR family transcriptional regulator n=1 Tax=Ulvibacterium marinum TaxID=2419782 RepID=A0A3B0C581_9FLAO|nr:TetR/AcrR family transcriptional regulator [Ulvibacterium marinum]RKN81203.1 TetR/AcrR family transcriptional regulator [Ulvibacterium marinum]
MKKENIHRALETGIKILSQKGYHNLGLREFLENAEIPSGSFYYYFKSKEDFAAKVLEHYGDKAAAYYTVRLLESDAPYTKRLETVFNEELQRLDATECKEGCMVGSLTSEIAGQNEVIQKVADSNYKKWQDIFERFFTEGQENGAFSTDFKASEMAVLFLTGRQGVMTRMKASGKDESYRLFRSFMMKIIER